jgi:adenylate cyclase class 2
MYEVELKVRAEHDRVRPRLESIGAEPEGTVSQVDTYYDHPVREFAETDEALRIRRETDESGESGERAKVTYKGPLVDDASKTREELETGVDDGDTMAGVVESVGFEPAATVEKRREQFSHGEYTVTLDAVEGLGEFVEVETEAEEIESTREGAVEVLERLGLDPADGIRTSYLGLLLDAA